MSRTVDPALVELSPQSAPVLCDCHNPPQRLDKHDDYHEFVAEVRAEARREVAEEVAGVCSELRATLLAGDEWTKGYVRALEHVEADLARITRQVGESR